MQAVNVVFEVSAGHLGTGWYCASCASHLLGEEIVQAYVVGPCREGSVWVPEMGCWLDVSVIDGAAALALSGLGCCQCLYDKGWRVVDRDGAEVVIA